MFLLALISRLWLVPQLGLSLSRQFVTNPSQKTVFAETKQLIDQLLLERIS